MDALQRREKTRLEGEQRNKGGKRRKARFQVRVRQGEIHVLWGVSSKGGEPEQGEVQKELVSKYRASEQSRGK